MLAGVGARIAFNGLATEWERSEQTGIAALMKGLFSTFRNPAAHAPRGGLGHLAQGRSGHAHLGIYASTAGWTRQRCARNVLTAVHRVSAASSGRGPSRPGGCRTVACGPSEPGSLGHHRQAPFEVIASLVRVPGDTAHRDQLLTWRDLIRMQTSLPVPHRLAGHASPQLDPAPKIVEHLGLW